MRVNSIRECRASLIALLLNGVGAYSEVKTVQRRVRFLVFSTISVRGASVVVVVVSAAFFGVEPGAVDAVEESLFAAEDVEVDKVVVVVTGTDARYVSSHCATARSNATNPRGLIVNIMDTLGSPKALNSFYKMRYEQKNDCVQLRFS